MTSVAAQSRSAPPTPEPVARGRLFVALLYLLRVVAALHALLALSQAFSIGRYLDGSYPMVRVHGIAAGIVILTGAVLGLVAVLYAVAGGRAWIAVVCVLFFFAEGFQTGQGYARALGIHVPLGVVIVALALLIAVLSWSRAAARRRPPRRAARAGEGERNAV
jgi:hypothetical protein